MATSVLAILILVHYVVMRHIKPAGWRPVFLAAFICLLYGTIGILIQRLGTYWYAASFLYVVPTVTFLVLAVLYYETIGEEPETWKKAVCIDVYKRQAMTVAKALGMKTIGLTGKDGGALKREADVSVVVPETETFKIQELHLPVYHALCLMLEERFF